MLLSKDSFIYSSVPAEVVTIAVFNYSSLHSLCCVMNRKFKSFKQTAFLSEQYAVLKVTSVWSAVLAYTQAYNCFSTCLLRQLVLVPFADKSFAVAGLKPWNWSLQRTVRNVESKHTFKRRSKTLLLLSVLSRLPRFLLLSRSFYLLLCVFYFNCCFIIPLFY